MATFVRRYPWLFFSLGVLAVVLVLTFTGPSVAIAAVTIAAAAVVLVRIGRSMAADIAAGHYGLDILAVVAIISTLLVQEYLATVIIMLMITGGEALEDYAERRAARELDALLARAPRTAHKMVGEEILDVPVGEVRVGDRLMVRPAEVVPVDGELASATAELDESSLTGESLPVQLTTGDPVLSGAVNQTAAIEIVATADSASSQYQLIVDLVRSAQESKAPMVRLADRFAIPFTVVSLLIGAVAWAISGEPVRFAEVMVLATPCPLLIAAPVAFLSGMSRAAKAGVIVKGGAALEQLARVRTAAFDKTGTLTAGELELSDLRPVGMSQDELLVLTASAEQYSSHALASSVQEVAVQRGVVLQPASQASEFATNGVEAVVDGREVVVGKRDFVAQHCAAQVPATELVAGELAIYVAVDGNYAGALVMRDALRHNAVDTVRRLHGLGVAEAVMLTGDAQATARFIADEVGIDTVHAGLLPQDKVRLVADSPQRPVMMVGDGVNDAPVLAAADVGVAMGARGATAASESADVVVLADDISKVADAVVIAQRTLRVAYGAIWVGIGLSIVLMLVAAAGHIPAVVGALSQEVVDLVAIGAALLALTSGKQKSTD